MNVNFGLFPPVAARTSDRGVARAQNGLAKKRAITWRALADLETWLAGARNEAAEQAAPSAAAPRAR
jgi:methylenetetrahydrofolate--tRNA-(uracil-5-)-methyltransferase